MNRMMIGIKVKILDRLRNKMCKWYMNEDWWTNDLKVKVSRIEYDDNY